MNVYLVHKSEIKLYQIPYYSNYSIIIDVFELYSCHFINYYMDTLVSYYIKQGSCANKTF